MSERVDATDPTTCYPRRRQTITTCRWVIFNITYMPMGLVALANILRGRLARRGGCAAEWLEHPKTTIPMTYGGHTIRAIGISLYWHYQSFDAIEMAAR